MLSPDPYEPLRKSMSRDPLEEIWHEYVDDNPEMTVKELESPVRFVRYLLRKRHVVPGWLIWFPIA